MNVEEITKAMLLLAGKEELRLQMGENGYKRVMKKYRIEYMQNTYWNIYKDFAESLELPWEEEPVKLPEETEQKTRKSVSK